MATNLEDLKAGTILANEGSLGSMHWVIDEDVTPDGADNRMLLSTFSSDCESAINSRNHNSVRHALTGMVVVSDEAAHPAALAYAKTLRKSDEDGLALYVVSEDYYRRGLEASGMRESYDSMRGHDTTDVRTFFARKGRRGAAEMSGDAWHVLIVPESDPRSRGMWTLDPERAPSTDYPYRGWNVETRYLTPVEGTVTASQEDSGTPAQSEETGASEGATVFTQEEVNALVERAARAGRDAATQEFERWKEATTELAHDFANDNSLCSEFDRFMGEVGLRPRTREYSVRVEVVQRGYAYVSVEASTDEEARDIVSEDPGQYVDTYAVDDWDVEYDVEDAERV